MGQTETAAGLVAWWLLDSEGSAFSSVNCVLDQGFGPSPSWLATPTPRWCLAVARKRDKLLGNREVIFRRALWTGFKACPPTQWCLLVSFPLTVLSALAGLGARVVVGHFSFSSGVISSHSFVHLLVLPHSFLPHGVCLAALAYLAGLHARYLDLCWLPPGLTDKVTCVH